MDNFQIKLDTIVNTSSFVASVKTLEKTAPPVNLKANIKVDSSLQEFEQIFSGPLTAEIDKTRERLKSMVAEGSLSSEMFTKLSADVDNVEQKMAKGNITFNKGTQELNKVTAAANGAKTGFAGMATYLIDIIKKFGLWYLVAGAVTGAIKLVKEMVENVKQLDAALVDLNKVYDATASELDEVTDRAYKAANALATTGIEVIKSITNFKRMGYTIEESEQLGELAIVMMNISENITNAGDAADTLGSIMKGLGVDSSYALSILNRLNEVSNNNAISFDDLATMLQQSAATMKILGNNVDETIGLLTAGFEVLQNQKVAKGIQTIGLRIAGLNEDLSTAEGLANDVSKALMKYADVSVWDETTGQLKNTYQILGEVARKWDEIGKTGGAQEALLNTLAGKQRADVAAAIIENWKAVEDAMEDAAKSEGSALRENERYIQSIEGHTAKLKNTFQDISRRVIDSGMIENVIDFGEALLQVIGYLMEYAKLLSELKAFMGGIDIDAIVSGIETISNALQKMRDVVDDVRDAIKPVTDFFGYYIGFGWLKDLIGDSNKLDLEYKDIAETFEDNVKKVTEYDKAMIKLKRTLSSLLDVASSELDALKEKNEQLEKEQEIQDKLLETQKAQMALEEARRKKTTVFRIGKGFVQDEDAEAVQEAQDNLQKAINDLSKVQYDYALDRTENFIEKLRDLITNGDIIDGWEDLFSTFGDLLNTEFASYIESAKEFVDEFKKAMEDANIDVGSESLKAVQRNALEKQISTLTEQLSNTTDSDERSSLNAQIAELEKKYNSIMQNANGTENFKGGLTWVGERGPEIVSLPKGTEILDNARSMSLKSIVDNGNIGSAVNGATFNFNGDLQFPNVSSGEDAQSFIDEIINIGRNSMPSFS